MTRGTLLLFVIILFAACSNSDNLAGVTTEPNDVAKETENALSASVGLSSGFETSGARGKKLLCHVKKTFLDLHQVPREKDRVHRHLLWL